ncbi:hypothetical protein GKA01_26490 [Gluconobacter kanchanaburiensis NBRC 103587]|uniref:Uncharacterized protein n=1 Tax=Gluconobacter kanchanaburiensis NBRC 103587 TaxID=1307948 RepID=A0A511BCE3_9PROT|nr:hypothetical protein AA103587_2431 [Gluconobacter kanchanaburiensis NBRC 103587]GEK97452.1 hypothetical protein GKA01_26490 [Gluconobacter kanchanaburiensis NBRC 103587]
MGAIRQAEGVPDLCREHRISNATLYRTHPKSAAFSRQETAAMGGCKQEDTDYPTLQMGQNIS